MGFPRQEYWNGLPFHPPGDLPGPGIEPASPAALALAGEFFTAEPPGKPEINLYWLNLPYCPIPRHCAACCRHAKLNGQGLWDPQA